MHILIAPDSFKESATAADVAFSIATGFKRVWPHADYTLAPMADGGEGTMEILVNATNGTYITCTVQDPIQRQIKAQYGILGNGKTAVIEMATASGLPLVEVQKRNPAITSTYGTGELIKDALHRGLRHIIVGLGGSATNDGGAGMAQALGYIFKNDKGDTLPPGGLALKNLAHIDSTHADPLLPQAHIEAAYDVHVPLVGPTSTSMMFAQQKGADETMAQELDYALKHFAIVIHQQLNVNTANLPGAGAAGGLGAGLAAFTKANLISGVQLVSQTINLESKIKKADLIITGEGKLDAQTQHGKVPAGVAALAQKHKKPVIAFAGFMNPNDRDSLNMLFNQIIPLCTTESDIPESIRHTHQRLTDKAEAFAQDWDRMITSKGE